MDNLFRLTLVCQFFYVLNVGAQISNTEGIKPMKGVVIPKAPTSQPQATKSGAVFKDCDDCPEMVVIPTGSFLMGSPPDPEPDPFSNAKPLKDGEDYEKPQHRVNIQSFAMGKYEVTQEQWYAVMGNNPSINKGRTLPVENVWLDDVQLFVIKLSQRTGKKYRLPSEAEWEYAARAGATTQFFWGDDINQASSYAWSSENSDTQSHPVGSKKPNEFGLYDIVGNVEEWTQDCWNQNYKGAPNDGSAWKSGDCSKRVMRGGSWFFIAQILRSAKRDSLTGNPEVKGRGGYRGFRVARDL